MELNILLNFSMVFYWLVDTVLSQQCQINILDSNEYVGCFVDSNIRLLPHRIDLGPLTQNTRCILLCRDLGYMFAGTEVGKVCFCGDDPWQYTAADVDSIYVGNYDCNSPCEADPSEICGGFWRLSVYRTGVKSDSSLTVQSRTVERQYIMMGEDKKMNDNIAFISSVNVKSKFHCAVLCSMYEACTGFVYSRINCQLYRIKYQDLCDFTLTEGGSSIYMID